MSSAAMWFPVVMVANVGRSVAALLSTCREGACRQLTIEEFPILGEVRTVLDISELSLVESWATVLYSCGVAGFGSEIVE